MTEAQLLPLSGPHFPVFTQVLASAWGLSRGSVASGAGLLAKCLYAASQEGLSSLWPESFCDHCPTLGSALFPEATVSGLRLTEAPSQACWVGGSCSSPKLFQGQGKEGGVIVAAQLSPSSLQVMPSTWAPALSASASANHWLLPDPGVWGTERAPKADPERGAVNRGAHSHVGPHLCSHQACSELLFFFFFFVKNIFY